MQNVSSFPKFKKKMWAEDEDKALVDLVAKHGTNNWVVISEQMKNRTGKQCRERWLNKHSPGVKVTQWTDAEDALLIEKQKQFGNSWVKISEFIEGRSADAIKTRFSWIKNKKRQKATASNFNVASIDVFSPKEQHIQQPLPFVPVLGAQPNETEKTDVLGTNVVPIQQNINSPIEQQSNSTPAKKDCPCSLPGILEAFSSDQFNCCPTSSIFAETIFNLSNNPEKRIQEESPLFSPNDPAFEKRDPNCFWKRK